jgi:hypothetical protein
MLFVKQNYKIENIKLLNIKVYIYGQLVEATDSKLLAPQCN